ncbi:hypothetical protein [Yersinia enterocolitica]|uniref:hypothetical protein n=1 Tax=Yersinia enterocolitica TaxID=630 RepID=UPI003D011A6B
MQKLIAGKYAIKSGEMPLEVNDKVADSSVSEGFTAPRYRLASYLASGISAANGLPDFNTP